MKTKLLITILFAILVLFTINVKADINFPNMKYQIGDCIISTDNGSSWYRKEAKVIEIVYAKGIQNYAYYLELPESTIAKNGFFSIDWIETNTAKASSCSATLYSN